MKSSEFQHKIHAMHEEEFGPYLAVPDVPRVKKVQHLFRQMAGRKKILDVGCGSGGILAPFAQQHEIHGAEIYGPLIPVAIKNGIRAVEHDIESGPLPFADASFDVVFCGETIEHQVDTDLLMFEINRVLKPGGQLILTYPNIRTVLGLLMMLLDLPPMYAARYRSSHFRDFTLKTIRVVMGLHSFAIDRAIGCSFYFPKIGEYGAGLAACFPSWANTVIIIATKVKNSDYDQHKPFKTEIY